MSSYKLDKTDREILGILKTNGRIQWREIGEEVHLTGQAVGERVRKMVDEKIIEGFYAKINDGEVDKYQTSFISVIMESRDHEGFLNLLKKSDQVVKVYRTSGHGCYMLEVKWSNQDELDELLEEILKYGNYQVNIVLKEYK